MPGTSQNYHRHHQLRTHYSKMKSFLAILVVTIFAFLTPLEAFTSSSVSSRASTSLSFGPFGQPKDDGSPGDYLCKVRSSSMAFVSTFFSNLCCLCFILGGGLDTHTHDFVLLLGDANHSLKLFPYVVGTSPESWIILIYYNILKGLWICLYQGTKSMGCIGRS